MRPMSPVASIPMNGDVPVTPTPVELVDMPSTPANPLADDVPLTPSPPLEVPFTPVPPFAVPRTPVPALVTPFTPESKPPDVDASVPNTPGALLELVPLSVVVPVSPEPFALLDATPAPLPLLAYDTHGLLLEHAVFGPAPPAASTRSMLEAPTTVPVISAPATIADNVAF